jgi:putative endonuclease
MAGHFFDRPSNLQDVPRVECPEPVEGLFWVYILQCRNETLYVGHTSDVGARVRRHEDGVGARHTRLLTPLRLVFVEAYSSQELALKREQQLKKWSRAKKLALLLGRRDDLRKLSESGKSPRTSPATAASPPRSPLPRPGTTAAASSTPSASSAWNAATSPKTPLPGSRNTESPMGKNWESSFISLPPSTMPMDRPSLVRSALISALASCFCEPTALRCDS